MKITLSMLKKIPTNLPLLMIAKDSASRYTWLTNGIAKQLGYSHHEELIGLNDLDVPLIAQYAEELMKNDFSAFSGSSQVFVEETLWQEYGLVKCVVMKSPLHDEQGNVCGTYALGTPLTNDAVNNLLTNTVSNLLNADKSQGFSQSIVVTPCDHQLHLTPRELEVLYYALRGHSSKGIASRLALSTKTVEFHLSNLKTKFGCVNKQQLIEAAIIKGYCNVLPLSIAITEKTVPMTFLNFNLMQLIDKYT